MSLAFFLKISSEYLIWVVPIFAKKHAIQEYKLQMP